MDREFADVDRADRLELRRGRTTGEREIMRHLLLAAVLLTGAFLAACGSSTASSPSTTTLPRGVATKETTPTTAPVDVQALLLSLSDLPAGWSVDHSNASASGSCYSQPLTKVPAVSYAHDAFLQGGSLPELT